MKFKEIVIDRLQNHAHKKNAAVSLTAQIETLKERVKLIDDGAPNADKKRLDAKAEIFQCEKLLKFSQDDISVVERALNAIEDEQRELLTFIYINNGSVPEWCAKHYISTTYAYWKLEGALLSFAEAMTD